MKNSPNYLCCADEQKTGENEVSNMKTNNKKIFILMVFLLAITISHAGYARTLQNQHGEITEERIVINKGTAANKSKVHLCEVTEIDEKEIWLTEDGMIYRMHVEGNEWVREGDKLFMECKDDALEEEAENVYFVTDGLLSKLERSIM